MKKIFAFIMAAFAALSLASCTHRHEIDTWSVDQYDHWHVCTKCGEEINVSEHEFRKNGRCFVCNAEVSMNSDGSYTVTVYDEEGNVKEKLVLGRDGTPA